jgi:D-alanyl-D-alanine carboxypeptidase/D-alanyl-D-alanine-endopeptidase (penicillin-binding protein 4)
VLATGPVDGGVVRGDLVLVGGGDPLLDTDALGDLAAAVAGQGIRGVTGRFLVADGALPPIARVEEGQPEEAGYNPAISGINLNFNRVMLAWEPGQAGPRTGFRATGARFDVAAEGFALELAEGLPAWRAADGREVWALPRASLRGRGSVWLPVRTPGVYAGAVFRTLAGQAGLVLPAADVVAEPPAGAVVAEHASEPLAAMIRGMLRYSTTLTAEVVGLTASLQRGVPAASLAQSAGAMADWAEARYGIADVRLVNHSGLSDRSRMSAAAMLRVLSSDLVAVRVIAAGAVFIDRAIAVVVDAFLSEKLPFSLHAWRRQDHDVRIIRVCNETAIWIAATHLCDVPVAVEVIGTVFIDQAIAVIVARRKSGAR